MYFLKQITHCVLIFLQLNQYFDLSDELSLMCLTQLSGGDKKNWNNQTGSTVLIVTLKKKKSKALKIKWSIYLLKWGEEERQSGLLLLSHFHLEEHTILTNLSAFITCFIVYIHKQKASSVLIYPLSPLCMTYDWITAAINTIDSFLYIKGEPNPDSTLKIMQVVRFFTFWGGAATSLQSLSMSGGQVCVASKLNQQAPV